MAGMSGFDMSRLNEHGGKPVKKGTFTRKKLREIIPGLTRDQEDQIIDLHLEAMENRKREEEEGCEETHSGISESGPVRVEIALRIR